MDFSQFPVIETERLLLRQMTDDDVPAIFDEYSHPEVIKYIDANPPVTDLKSAKDMLDWYHQLYADKYGWRWGVALKTTNELIGTCGFHQWYQDERHAEIGYDFRFAFWGKGYATEVVQRAIEFGFNKMTLHRIEADCDERNIGSARVLEKTGFTLEGIWRERAMVKGEFINLKQYGILEREYRQTST